MTNFRAAFIVSVLAAITATVLVVERKSRFRLQQEIHSLQEQRAEFSEGASQNTEPSNPRAQTTPSEISPSEPEHELLRLRGEIARLRRELDELGRLRREDSLDLQRLRSANRVYTQMMAVDTNGLPQIKPEAGRSEVLAELQRIEAKILTDDPNTIWAEARPSAVTNYAGGLQATRLRMGFYFEEGQMVSSKYIRECE